MEAFTFAMMLFYGLSWNLVPEQPLACPVYGELDRFPSKVIVERNIKIAQSQLSWCKERQSKMQEEDRWLWDKPIDQAREVHACWYLLYILHNQMETDEDREGDKEGPIGSDGRQVKISKRLRPCAQLESLRDRIGVEKFYAGDMPYPIPEWVWAWFWSK